MQFWQYFWSSFHVSCCYIFSYVKVHSISVVQTFSLDFLFLFCDWGPSFLAMVITLTSNLIQVVFLLDFISRNSLMLKNIKNKLNCKYYIGFMKSLAINNSRSNASCSLNYLSSFSMFCYLEFLILTSWVWKMNDNCTLQQSSMIVFFSWETVKLMRLDLCFYFVLTPLPLSE